MPDAFIIVVAGSALAFDFIAGFHDAANAIATSVLTRALKIPTAIAMAAALNLAGGLLHQAVALTVGKGIVDPGFMNLETVFAAVLGAILWELFTWRLGLPSSATHALIGGLVGAAAAAHLSVTLGAGHLTLSLPWQMYNPVGLRKVLTGLVCSPLIGFTASWLLMVLLYHIFAHTPPRRLNGPFRRLQVFSAGFMAFSHGTNDAQNGMGVMTLALLSGGYLDSFVIPLWVRLLCAMMIGLGTAAGGWRIIKTMGRRVMDLQPIHGFAAETSAATAIQCFALWGAPISTTHVISSAIMGVGSARRLSAVRWKVVSHMLLAWVLTIPLSALVAALCYYLLHPLLG